MKRQRPAAMSTRRKQPIKKRKKDIITSFTTPVSHNLGGVGARLVEKKWVDVANYSSINTTPGIVLLNGVAQGTNSFNRLGRSCFNDSIWVRWWISAQSDAQDLYYNRVMLVWDFQPNQNLPAFGDICVDVTSTGAGTVTAISAQNLNNKKRFMILRDERFLTPTSETTPGGTFVVNDTPSGKGGLFKEWFVNLKGLEQTQNDVNATIGNITTGSLLLVFVNTDSSIVSNWYFNYAARLRFHD